MKQFVLVLASAAFGVLCVVVPYYYFLVNLGAPVVAEAPSVVEQAEESGEFTIYAVNGRSLSCGSVRFLGPWVCCESGDVTLYFPSDVVMVVEQR